MLTLRDHGGPDASGAARWDFSTNANACGPCPGVLQALQAADASRYPDPQYTALRHALAAWHGVEPGRIVIAASASEFIMRVTAVGGRLAPGPVAVPLLAYGDYARAALAHGRALVHDARQATLVWQCDPSSPLGQAAAQPVAGEAAAHAAARPVTAAGALQVLDAAYAPSRLDRAAGPPAAPPPDTFVLHSPNKALGLTGVRGAYAVAPPDAQAWVDALDAAAPSWALGAHAVAMLAAWPTDAVQQWLAGSLHTLRGWKQSQTALFARLGCEVAPSVTNFFCARWPGPLPLAALRGQGIALRDCTSFGLPGWVRASVQPPQAQQALQHALI